MREHGDRNAEKTGSFGEAAQSSRGRVFLFAFRREGRKMRENQTSVFVPPINPFTPFFPSAMKLRSTLFFAAASLSASALLPVAATTSAFFAASAVPAMAWEIDETTGLPDATLPGTATTVSEEHLVSEDTAYSFTDAGQNSNVNITLSNGAGALLLPSGQNSQYALGTVSGDGDVWFGGGRWRVLTAGETPTNITSTGTLYLSGAQFWVTDGQGAGGAFSTNNDVVLGLSNFSGDGIPELDNTALRVDAAVTLNGTTTIIPAGTRIGFQNGKDLTIARDERLQRQRIYADDFRLLELHGNDLRRSLHDARVERRRRGDRLRRQRHLIAQQSIHFRREL